MADHTTGPWLVLDGSPNAVGAFDPEAPDVPWHVALCLQCAGDERSNSGAENAAFIVRACNAHDDFVKALIAAEVACGHDSTKDERKQALALVRAALNTTEAV